MTRTAPLESVTWEFFLAKFRKWYVGSIYLSNMRREFPGDLIELSFREFDVILGMDWFSRH